MLVAKWNEPFPGNVNKESSNNWVPETVSNNSAETIRNMLDLHAKVLTIEEVLNSWAEITSFIRDDEYPKMNWWNLRIKFIVSNKEYTLLLKATVVWELDVEMTQEKWYNIYNKWEDFAILQFWEDECNIDNDSIILSELNKAANAKWFENNLYVYVTQEDGTITTSHRNNMSEEEINKYENEKTT
jgi:hypothetical protein